MQRLTLSLIICLPGLGREHQPQGIDDVSASFLAGSPLAEDAVNLRDRRDDPAILARLVDDRQIKLLGHQSQDTAQRRALGVVLWRETIPGTQQSRFEHRPTTGWEGKSSKTYLVMKRISELHHRRFGSR
jgi:hypothetical protein